MISDNIGLFILGGTMPHPGAMGINSYGHAKGTNFYGVLILIAVVVGLFLWAQYLGKKQ